MRLAGLSVAVFAAVVLGALPARSADPHFHPATTPTEVALNRILTAADADRDQLANLLHRPGADGRVDYRNLLTPGLIAAMRKAERDLVSKECGGRYRQGEICGLDYSPLTCSQDTPPSYVFHTVLELGDKTVIEMMWPSESATAATYTLVRQGGVWKIDGVTCAGGGQFH